jgi:F-type H+-transporting ATPase subunit epsilon
MANTGNRTVRVVVVTPEKAVLDESSESVVLPMFDGELGVLPGRAAFVGQLAAGELRLTTAGITKRYFVDAGFAQVHGDTVNVLTSKASAAADVTPAAVQAAQSAANALPANNPAEKETKAKAGARAAAMARVAAKN